MTVGFFLHQCPLRVLFRHGQIGKLHIGLGQIGGIERNPKRILHAFKELQGRLGRLQGQQVLLRLHVGSGHAAAGDFAPHAIAQFLIRSHGLVVMFNRAFDIQLAHGNRAAVQMRAGNAWSIVDSLLPTRGRPRSGSSASSRLAGLFVERALHEVDMMLR